MVLTVRNILHGADVCSGLCPVRIWDQCSTAAGPLLGLQQDTGVCSLRAGNQNGGFLSPSRGSGDPEEHLEDR